MTVSLRCDCAFFLEKLAIIKCCLWLPESVARHASLPDKQAKRIYAHFILGMTKQDIARAEGVHEKVVRVAIERGLRHLEKILKKSL